MVTKYSGLLLLKGCKHSQQNKLLQNDIMTIDKQKGLRRDCVCSVEDGELEVGGSGVSRLCMITEKTILDFDDRLGIERDVETYISKISTRLLVNLVCSNGQLRVVTLAHAQCFQRHFKGLNVLLPM